MSHQPERREKNCLNCGTMVQGRFCHVCGQENTITHQGFWSLTKHFIYDILHFDGKFFETLRYLLFKPGWVPKEYVAGKQVRYLDPIRMYLFTSAVFFLAFFSFAKPEFNVREGNVSITGSDRSELIRDLQELQKTKPGDSTISHQIELLKDTDRVLKSSDLYAISPFITISGKRYDSVADYHRFQKKLPKEKRDNWLKRQFITKEVELNQKYRGKAGEGLQVFAESFLHRLPYLLFVSLPFFALILKMLYVRRRNFFYSDHAVFTLYQYIFTFFLLLFIFSFNSLKAWLHWAVFDYLIFAALIWWLIYLYKAMRRFYGQSRLKTFGKFLLLNFLAFISLLVLFVLFILFSVFNM